MRTFATSSHVSAECIRRSDKKDGVVMQQLSLFSDDTPAYVVNAKSLARAEHPSTSHEAAAIIVDSLGELHRWTVECVTLSPGLTAKELAMKYCPPEDERKIGRRLPEVERLGLIRRGAIRRCTASRSHANACTWFPISEGNYENVEH